MLENITISATTALIVFGLLTKFALPSYLKEKGKNLATKEDIKDITDKIEGVKSQYERSNHAFRFQFEKEYGHYMAIWEKLVDVRQAVLTLRPVLERIDPKETDEDRWIRKIKGFVDSYNPFIEVVEKNKPFYHEDVWLELTSLSKVMRSEALDFEILGKNREGRDIEEYYKTAKKNSEDILNHIDKICAAIRKRIQTI